MLIILARAGIVETMITVHYFAAARQAAGVAAETIDAPATVGELLSALSATHSGTTAAGMSFSSVLARCSFLVDGRSADEATTLAGAQRVDILPPFAGG